MTHPHSPPAAATIPGAILDTPVGAIALYADTRTLYRVEFLPPQHPPFETREASPPIQRALVQLSDYFRDPTSAFSLPLASGGTPFQRRVWSALERIPPGQVRTYGELARALDTAPRAVAAACRANPLPIIVPCHRVVAADGPGGYAGAVAGRPLAVKQWLLEHEGAPC
ncbi:methylated-DNA--[protein]-cysteine S-methyltransferase [Ectothiorhodospira mobilis]|uniref:methylated-DNA--[protein]-cysteine S-methyltransferase n=1 Tax=Ectothiorhodospira mobilis TaxID=195064 RepID=UPI0019063BDC|nr:methylated-DNA--[protein]-cysteine S-methyltransferase [Ectothiorhodospira mobilis]MBK1691245.1 hypothetical protein [Ectothiorhodospira mobilis]